MLLNLHSFVSFTLSVLVSPPISPGYAYNNAGFLPYIRGIFYAVQYDTFPFIIIIVYNFSLYPFGQIRWP